MHTVEIHRSTYALDNLLFCVVGGEPVPSASAEEKSSDRKPGENEPAAVPGGQQILPPRLQEHRWLVAKQIHIPLGFDSKTLKSAFAELVELEQLR